MIKQKSKRKNLKLLFTSTSFTDTQDIEVNMYTPKTLNGKKNPLASKRTQRKSRTVKDGSERKKR